MFRTTIILGTFRPKQLQNIFICSPIMYICIFVYQYSYLVDEFFLTLAFNMILFLILCMDFSIWQFIILRDIIVFNVVPSHVLQVNAL